ncbi:MAG: acyl-CoA desaturase [Bacteroidetes bacterium]|nr:acyl-CoA desaturase [Bacteroidota bacterium]
MDKMVMKILKFIPKDKTLFTSAVRKNVNDYFKTNNISTKANWKMVVKTIFMLCLYIIPFIFIVTLPMSQWLIFPLSALMGVGMAGIGMSVMHDAVHGSYSQKSWINNLIGHSMYLIGGNTFNWKVQHNMLHHTFTNIEGHDEDIEPKAVFRLSKHSPLKKMHRFQHLYAFFFYCLMTILRMTNEFKQLKKYNYTGITATQGSTPRKENIKLIIGKFLYLALSLGLPLIFSGFTWWMILLGFAVMHFIAGLIMSTVFQMAHVVEEAEQPLTNGEGNIENEWTIHQLETTVNFSHKSRVFAWLIGGLNYQIEHHLFPNICHVHYRHISPIVANTAKEHGLVYHQHPTFFNAVGSHLRLLKTLGSGVVPA